jgi:hypothetical protein
MAGQNGERLQTKAREGADHPIPYLERVGVDVSAIDCKYLMLWSYPKRRVITEADFENWCSLLGQPGVCDRDVP